MDLLTEVHDLKVCPERTNHVRRRGDIEPLHRLAHRDLGALLPESTCDRGGPYLLDAGEERRAALLLEHIAHQGAGDADIATERLVLARKIDRSHD